MIHSKNTCIYSYKNTCIYSYKNTCIYSYKNICIYSDKNTCIHSYKNACIYSYKNTCIYSDKNTCIYSYKNTCIYSFIQKHMQKTQNSYKTQKHILCIYETYFQSFVISIPKNQINKRLLFFKTFVSFCNLFVQFISQEFLQKINSSCGRPIIDVVKN